MVINMHGRRIDTRELNADKVKAMMWLALRDNWTMMVSDESSSDGKLFFI